MAEIEILTAMPWLVILQRTCIFCPIFFWAVRKVRNFFKAK